MPRPFPSCKNNLERVITSFMCKEKSHPSVLILSEEKNFPLFEYSFLAHTIKQPYHHGVQNDTYFQISPKNLLLACVKAPQKKSMVKSTDQTSNKNIESRNWLTRKMPELFRKRKRHFPLPCRPSICIPFQGVEEKTEEREKKKKNLNCCSKSTSFVCMIILNTLSAASCIFVFAIHEEYWFSNHTNNVRATR